MINLKNLFLYILFYVLLKITQEYLLDICAHNYDLVSCFKVCYFIRYFHVLQTFYNATREQYSGLYIVLTARQLTYKESKQKIRVQRCPMFYRYMYLSRGLRVHFKSRTITAILFCNVTYV